MLAKSAYERAAESVHPFSVNGFWVNVACRRALEALYLLAVPPFAGTMPFGKTAGTVKVISATEF